MKGVFSGVDQRKMSSRRKEPGKKGSAGHLDWVSSALAPLPLKAPPDSDALLACAEISEGGGDCDQRLATPFAEFLVVSDRRPAGPRKRISQKPDSRSRDSPPQQCLDSLSRSADLCREDSGAATPGLAVEEGRAMPATSAGTAEGGEAEKGSSVLRSEEESPVSLEEISVRRVVTLASASVPSIVSEEDLMINLQEQEDELLALEAIYGDKYRLLIKEDDKPAICKISVPVDLPGNVEVVVELPADSVHCDQEVKTEQGSNAQTKKDVTESPSSDRRSASMPYITTHSFMVQYMPPLELTFTFPNSYPFGSPPIFSLSSSWLSVSQLSVLCKGLDHIWEDQVGQVVVYAWVEWLQNQTLVNLGGDGKLYLRAFDVIVSQEQEIDPRVVSGCSSPEKDISFLLRYNEDMRLEDFHKSWHTCNICLTEKSGKDFVKLPCQHFFCWLCMEQYSSVHVKEGSVNNLNCPDTTCRRSIPPFLLKKLLDKDDYERWEELLLQRTLDSMMDIVYCPRCETVSIEDKDHHAQCGGCFFNFCSLCQSAWHVGQACLTPEARLRILQERQKGRVLGDEQRKKEQDLVNELLNLKYVDRETKLCPTCRMAISKTEGCNKMTCSNCGKYFCFRCGKAIDGYDHFGSGSCVLFEQADIEIWERQINHRQLEAQARLELWPDLGRSCPNCRQRNIKEGNNNHIFCWACQNHYCALCNKMVRRAAEHYGPNKCRQHTAD